MRVTVFPNRLRRRRPEAPRPAVAEKLLAAPLTVPAVKTRPYSDTLAVSQVAAYRIAAMSEFYFPQPGFEASPGKAPETAPMQALAPGVPAVTDEDPPEIAVLQKLHDGLQHLDWEALDAARDLKRATYARTAGAPFHNALAREWRSPLLSVGADGDWKRVAWRPPARPARRHGDAVARKVGELSYPEVSGFTAPGVDELYAELLRCASVITGTTGIGNWRPVTPAGGAA